VPRGGSISHHRLSPQIPPPLDAALPPSHLAITGDAVAPLPPWEMQWCPPPLSRAASSIVGLNLRL
jgi:hypothetical protein